MQSQRPMDNIYHKTRRLGMSVTLRIQVGEAKSLTAEDLCDLIICTGRNREAAEILIP